MLDAPRNLGVSNYENGLSHLITCRMALVMMYRTKAERDSPAFTRVEKSMAIHSNLGIRCNEERHKSAWNPPRADLSDP